MVLLKSKLFITFINRKRVTLAKLVPIHFFMFGLVGKVSEIILKSKRAYLLHII